MARWERPAAFGDDPSRFRTNVLYSIILTPVEEVWPESPYTELDEVCANATVSIVVFAVE
jgi:hypothetical protein